MRLNRAFLLSILIALTFTVSAPAQTPAARRMVSGEILVKFRPGTSDAAKANAHRTLGGTRLNEVARTGLQRVRVNAGNEIAAAARYRGNPDVLYAEPNFVRSIPAPASHSPGTELLPGDHYFKEQWALHNTGQMFVCFPWIDGDLCLYQGTPDADIDAPEAWAMSTSSGTKVAVIDSGVDYTHPDLAANYIGGYDYIFGDNDPMDDNGHGTHVAGTIAAAMNNLTGDPAAEEGVVGVAPNARILAYKVCQADGSCSDFAIVQAIAQAIEDRAQVINMSLGGPEYSQALFDAVQDAWSAGAVIVAGAGNDGTSAEFYPAAFPNVVSVAAFDEDHRRTPFSNFGTWVDISAPGNFIMSSYPMSACLEAGVPGDMGCYTWLSGTSMATPHVSGAAALVWTRSDVTSNSRVVDILLNSADPVGVDRFRLDSWTIHGGLNVHNAMSYGTTNAAPAANAGADLTVEDTGGDGQELVTLDGSGSSDPDGTIVSYEWRDGDAVVGLVATPEVWLSVGTHVLTLTVSDDDGAAGTDTVVVTINPAPNAPPVANAGPDQTVTDTNRDGAETVTLNGSASSDTDGTIASHEWLSGNSVVATGATPTVSLPVGVHPLTLRVTDDDGSTATDSVVITVNEAPNLLPVANAGSDQTVTDNNRDGAESVTLNGSGSSDTDGTIVSYEWLSGNSVVANGATPTISLPVGAHTLTLRVTDDDGASATDSVSITVNEAPNLAPVANAGADQTVTDSNRDGGERVTLSGSASSDADGTIVSYEWLSGNNVVATGATPTVSLPVGAHSLTLRVTDDDGATATDSVAVTVNEAPNLAPVANAGADQTVIDANRDGGEPVTLNGGASSDADGTIVSYEWLSGDNVVATGAAPTISLPVGAYSLTLRVTDDDGSSATDVVMITVNAPPPISMHIGDLDGVSVGNKGTWTAHVMVKVHDASHQAVADATVTGRWSEGVSGTESCTTTTNGTCVFDSEDIRKRNGTITFTVTGVSVNGHSYSAAQNHDADGDSDGTSISLDK